MLHSRIEPDGQTRNWCRHGDPLIGVRLTPWPHNDHDEAQRLGRFVRPTCLAEDYRDLVRPLETPVAVVAPAGPKTVKRYFVAMRPGTTPWPDPADVPDTFNFHIAADQRVVEQGRRL
jgi:hypothetical protein